MRSLAFQRVGRPAARGLAGARRRGVAAPAPTPAAMTAGTTQGPTNLDPDGGNYGVDTNGWAMLAQVPFASGATFDPSKIVVTVTDPGFNTDGTAATRTRIIRGTVLIRRQMPNNTQRLAANNGGTYEAYFGLDDLIYQGSTIVSIVAEAGYCGAAQAGDVAGKINASTRPYYAPQLAWLNLQHERATGSTFPVELVAYHRHGMNAQQVACIEFTAWDAQGTPNASPMVRCSQPTLSAIQTKGQIVEAWKASLALANLTQGDICQVNAVVKPWIGTAYDLAANEVAWPTANPHTRLRFKNDKTGAYGGVEAWVLTGATGGAVGSRTTPFPTIDAAITAVLAANNAKGHNDLAGATIYLRDNAGTAQGYEISNSISSVAAGDCWFTIAADPLNTAKAFYNMTINRGVPSLFRLSCDVEKPGSSAAFNGNSTTVGSGVMIATDGNIVNLTAGTVTPWIRNAGLVYQRNVTYPTAGGNRLPALADDGGSGLRCALALGVDYQGTSSVFLIPYAAIGCKGRLYLDTPSTSQQTTNDGMVVANNRFNRLGSGIAIGSQWDYSARGMAFMQNVLEFISGDSFSLGGDGMGRPLDNINALFNTVPHNPANVNEDMGRFNHAYTDVAGAKGVTKRMVFSYNLCARYATKTDTFDYVAQGSGRVGNWERHYGVGCRGNVMMIARAPDPDGTSWGGAWNDALSADNVGSVPFTNSQAGIGAAGGGTYSLTGASNPAYNRVAAGLAPLRYDMAGVARRNDGTGAAGAYERTV